MTTLLGDCPQWPQIQGFQVGSRPCPEGVMTYPQFAPAEQDIHLHAAEPVFEGIVKRVGG